MGLLFNVETSSEICCFAGFYHHCFMTMSAHTHVYHYPLFESGIKAGLRMIALCRKYRLLLSKHKTVEFFLTVVIDVL